MTTAALRLSINWKVFCIISFAMLFFSLIFYIYQINNLTSGTYLIDTYESKISNLYKENRKMEVAFAESSFLGNVESRTRQLNFQKTSGVKYIEVPDYLLAKAK